MTVTAAQLIDDPALLAQATGDVTHKPAIPDSAEPPKPHIRS